ncbi:MAG: hypothetical protein WC423_14425 [Vulcanimicrobiota bacterium]
MSPKEVRQELALHKALWALAIPGFVVVVLAWSAAYRKPFGIGFGFINDADVMYPEQIFMELLRRGGSLSEWHLTPAPYLVDLIGYCALRLFSPNAYWGCYVFSLVQIIIAFLISMGVAYSATRSFTALIWSLSGCFLGFYAALGRVEPYCFVFYPAYHACNLLGGALVIGLTAQAAKHSKVPVNFGLGIALLTVCGMASDLFMLVTFVLPIAISLFIWLCFDMKVFDLKDRRWQLIGLHAISAASGVLLARIITVKTSPPLLGITLGEAFWSLLEIPQTLIRIFWIAPVPNTFLVLFYTFIFWNCATWVRQRLRGGGAEFPFWELTLVCSPLVLLLFLGLRDMLHYPETPTVRYLLTVAWLPFLYAWVPFRQRLGSSWVQRAAILLALVGIASLLYRSHQDSLGPRTNYRSDFIVDLDRYIQEVETATGREMKHGVSTYWRAKSTMSQSDQGILIAQYTSDLDPYLWITSKRWYQGTYDFALAAFNEEDDAFLRNLEEKCGKPMLIKDCGGNMRFVVFPEGALKLPVPNGGYEGGIDRLIPGEEASRLAEKKGILSPTKAAENHIVVFGPYIKLKPGQYQAAFVLERGQGEGPGQVTCEVVSDRGRHSHGSVLLDISEFVPFEIELVNVPFVVESEEAHFEFRVWKSGAHDLILRDMTVESRS